MTLREGRTLVKLPMASHLPGLPPLDDQSLPPGLAIEPIEIALVLHRTQSFDFPPFC